MVRQRRLIGVVTLIGCALLLLVVGCSGTRSEAPQEEKQQGHTEATNTEQGRTAEVTASKEAKCEGTRTIKQRYGGPAVTNDVPGCPKGGPLLGTDNPDKLSGKGGDDEIRGLGGSDEISDGRGTDLVYGGTGEDNLIGTGGDTSMDRFYGGRGKDIFQPRDVPAVKDIVRCEAGTDTVYADQADVIGDACERVRVR